MNTIMSPPPKDEKPKLPDYCPHCGFPSMGGIGFTKVLDDGKPVIICDSCRRIIIELGD